MPGDAHGIIRTARLDILNPRFPTYIYGPLLACARRDPKTGAVVFEDPPGQSAL